MKENPPQAKAESSQVSQTDSLQLTGIYSLKAYPIKEFYRLGVDGRFHQSQSGWRGYESREPGSVQALFKGLASMINHLTDSKLSLELIKKLHIQFTANVQFKKKSYNKPGNYRSAQSFIPIDINNSTPKGIEALLNIVEYTSEAFPAIIFSDYFRQHLFSLDKKVSFSGNRNIQLLRHAANAVDNKELAEKLYHCMETAGEETPKLDYYCSQSNQINHDMNQIIDSYNQAIQDTHTYEQKLIVIVRHIWEFEHLHPFADGNTRTFSIGLLNWMLIKNNFPPVTAYNPNVIEGYSVEEMITVIREGIKNTLRLIRGETQLFDYETSEILDSETLQIVNEALQSLTISEQITPNNIVEELLAEINAENLINNADNKDQFSAKIRSPFFEQKVSKDSTPVSQETVIKKSL